LRRTLLISVVGFALGCVDNQTVGSFAPDAEAPPDQNGSGDDSGAPTPAPPPITSAKVQKATTRIAASTYATCATTSTGGVLCWGDNSWGQLGFQDPGNNPSAKPVAPPNMPAKVIGVARGRHAHCALVDNDQPTCWGDVGFGLDEATGNLLLSIVTPTQISPALSSDVANVGFGAGFGCVLLTSAHVKCWGMGANGALGSGQVVDSDTPKQIAGVKDALVDFSASASSTFACAATASGGVVCWGFDANRELGHPTTPGGDKFDATPEPVGGLPEQAKAIASGRAHACALLASGHVACWGADDHGQMGHGTTGTASTPVVVDGVAGATSIFVGHYHTCAVLGGGSVTCWGENAQAQIGNGATPAKATEIVPASFGAVAGSAGDQHTCVVSAAGHVRCIGSNDRMRLGPGDFTLP
jgi:alpha-tubulin suppressor-like RCC1 family protein